MSAKGRPERELLPLGGKARSAKGAPVSAKGRPERELLPLGGKARSAKGAPTTLSVILIAKDEEACIARALHSVAWADEIVVVDSGSSDRTVDIAREHGAKVTVTADWPGFGPQKNRALDLATGDWVLSLDADEWLTAESAEEIRRVVSASEASAAAYRMPRRSSFCGRFMRHSGWWPDYVVRLFRRGSARFSEDSVHERVIADGPLATLREPIMHETFVDFDDLIGKMNRYSTLTAQQLRQDGKTAGLLEALARALWAFLRTYVFRAGFLDGREGFMLALATAEGTYYRYVKLMRLSRK
jgi:glycosyltransferase involved in cell wall biosynthesis